MTKRAYKNVQFFMVLITFFVFFFSLYAEYFLKLEPCPLCLMQRLCVFLLLALMGISLRTVKQAHFLSFLQIFIAGAGLFFALRQLWLQSLPPGSAPACMPGLDILIRYFPWKDVAHAFLWGTGDCAEQTLSIFGISMAGWSALYFLLMICLSLFLMVRTRTPE